ncbi:MAG: tetratricopeptide repeat protein [Nitrospinae bacterium]|nr:tetratricopeptide repeat protein [Nitrospinota bacterium]
MRRVLLPLLLLAFTASCQLRPVNLMAEAENLYLKNQYRESVRVFLQIVDRYPGSKDAEVALLRVGQTFQLNLNNPQNALEYFSRLVSEYPNGEKVVQAREAMAGIYDKNLRDYDKALEQYRLLLDVQGVAEPDKYMIAIGRCYYLKEDYKEAMAAFRSVVEKHPNSKYAAEAEYQIGNCLFVSNKCEDAIRQYNAVLTKYPETKYRNDIILSLGVCMEEKEDYDGALKMYKDIEDKYDNKVLIKRRIEALQTRMKNKHR